MHKTIQVSNIGKKRRTDVLSEYSVKFANGEVLLLPPRQVTRTPVFKDGKLETIGENDRIVTDEVQGWITELVESTDGDTLSGRPLELLFNIAAYLISKVYDVSDEDLALLLTIKHGTNEFWTLKDQWPSKVYRWVLGGDEITEMLAKEDHGRSPQSED